jgi:hypothetical protein
MDANLITGIIVDASVKIHSATGLGMLLNFKIDLMKDGIYRVFNNFGNK